MGKPTPFGEGVGFLLTCTLICAKSPDRMANTVILYPFWNGSDWVFNDPRMGLEEEQFVEGVPAMLERLLEKASIPRDEAVYGFRLKMSDSDFPERQAVWVRKERYTGGNWYLWEEEGLRGWMCAQLQNYFGRAPEQLYLHTKQTR